MPTFTSTGRKALHSEPLAANEAPSMPPIRPHLTFCTRLEQYSHNDNAAHSTDGPEKACGRCYRRWRLELVGIWTFHWSKRMEQWSKALLV